MSTNTKPKIIDYFFVLRPLILLPVWAFVVFGYFQGALAEGTVGSVGFWRITPLNWEFPAVLALYSLLFGAIFILNQIADYETDRLHPRIWLIASDKFPKQTAAWEMVIIALAALAGSMFFPQAFLIFAATLFLGIVYSIPPTRFSGRPFFDFITNSLGHGLAPFALGWTFAGGDMNWELVKSASPYIFLMTAGAINSTIQDIKDDKATGRITTSVKYGAKKALALSTIFLLFSINLSLLMGDLYCLVMGLVSFIFFLNALIKGLDEDYLKTLHIPGPFVVFLAGSLYPPMIIAIIALYFAARWYYPFRFGVDYPKVGK